MEPSAARTGCFFLESTDSSDSLVLMPSCKQCKKKFIYFVCGRAAWALHNGCCVQGCLELDSAELDSDSPSTVRQEARILRVVKVLRILKITRILKAFKVVEWVAQWHLVDIKFDFSLSDMYVLQGSGRYWGCLSWISSIQDSKTHLHSTFLRSSIRVYLLQSKTYQCRQWWWCHPILQHKKRRRKCTYCLVEPRAILDTLVLKFISVQVIMSLMSSFCFFAGSRQ